MKRGLIVGMTCLAMGAPSFQSAMVPWDDSAFIETILCATGRVIRIPIGGDEDDVPDQMRACHALCSRDSDLDDDGSARSDNG